MAHHLWIWNSIHSATAATTQGPLSNTANFVSRTVQESFELQTDSEGEVVPGVNVNYYYLHV